MRPTRVLVLYNQPVLAPDHPDAASERDVLETVEVVSGYLLHEGFSVCRLGVSHDPQVLLSGLWQERPEVVFNLFEGTADDGDTEAHVAGLLEWLGIPFTGCPARTACIARDKPLTKHLLRGAALAT